VFATDEHSGKVINIWTVEDERFSDLLSVALTKDNIFKTCIIITLDASLPHLLLKSFHKWYSIIENRIRKIQEELPLDIVEKLKKECGNSNAEVNIGVPIVIAPCKCDQLTKLAEEYSLQLGSQKQLAVQFLNFVQFHLRLTALKCMFIRNETGFSPKWYLYSHLVVCH